MYRMDHFGKHVCGTCAYFAPEVAGETGHCRRYPPKIVQEQLDAERVRLVTEFPLVWQTAFCGEHSDCDKEVGCGCTMGQLAEAERASERRKRDGEV